MKAHNPNLDSPHRFGLNNPALNALAGHANIIQEVPTLFSRIIDIRKIPTFFPLQGNNCKFAVNIEATPVAIICQFQGGLRDTWSSN